MREVRALQAILGRRIRVLAHESISPLVWGGKGVGSQGDGSAQLVARSETDRDEVMRILDGEPGLSCLALDLRPVPGQTIVDV